MSKHYCMLAQKYDPKRVIFPCYVQPKLDGVRGIYNNSLNKFITRNGNVLNLPRLEKRMLEFNNLPSILDGELMLRGKKFDEISGIIRTEENIPEKDEVNYIIFDCIMSGTFNDRWERIKHYKVDPYVHAISCTIAYSLQDVDILHRDYLRQNYEGSIIRLDTAEYELKRSFSLMKRKETVEILCKNLYYIEGTGKYEGMLGALVLEMPNGNIFDVGSGLTDYQREFFWKNRCIDTVLVKYQELTEFGKPRFPVCIKINMNESYYDNKVGDKT